MEDHMIFELLLLPRGSTIKYFLMMWKRLVYTALLRPGNLKLFTSGTIQDNRMSETDFCVFFWALQRKHL